MKHCFNRVLFFVFCSISSLTYAQSDVAPKYSNEFLSIGVGADALGVGNAVVAQSKSVTSGYWNPAGLTRMDKWLEVAAMHSEYFAGIAKYDYVGIGHKLDEKSAIAFSAIRFAVDDIPNTTQLIDNNGNIDYDRVSYFTAADWGLILSYARKLKIEGLSIGGNFKIVHRKVGDFAKSWGFGLDFGLQYETKNKWQFGLMAQDITSTFNAWIFSLDEETREVFLKTGNEIPENGLELTLPRFTFAAHKKFDLGKKGFYIAPEIDFTMTTDGKRNTLLKTNAVSFEPRVGLAVGFKKYVTLRAGINNFQQVKDFDDKKRFQIQPNIGIGLHFKGISIDYAFTDIGDVSTALYSHVISLKVQLNKPSKKTK